MHFSSFGNVSYTNSKTINNYLKLSAVCEPNSGIEMFATKISLLTLNDHKNERFACSNKCGYVEFKTHI